MNCNCYYGEACQQYDHDCEGCEYYHPVGTEAENDYLYAMTERERIAFRSEWFIYTEKFFS